MQRSCPSQYTEKRIEFDRDKGNKLTIRKIIQDDFEIDNTLWVYSIHLEAEEKL